MCLYYVAIVVQYDDVRMILIVCIQKTHVINNKLVELNIVFAQSGVITGKSEHMAN